MAELIEYRGASTTKIIHEALGPMVDEPADWQALITMLHPGLYSADRETHLGLLAEPDLAEFAEPGVIDNSLGPLAARAIKVKWLRVLPDVGMHGHTTDDIYAEILALFGHQEVGGAEVRFTFFSQCWKGLLDKCLGAVDARVYLSGAVMNIPKRSFQAYFQAGRLALINIGEYSDNQRGHGAFSNRLLKAPYTPASGRETYAHFWLNVFDDPQKSLSLEEAYNLPSTSYPRHP